MINIEKQDNGYLIENKFWFTESTPKAEYINLIAFRWEDMEYWNKDYFTVSFPWEYDKEEISIRAYEWDSKKLNFFIKFEDKNIFLVQTPNILESQDIPTVNNWIYNDPYTEKLLEKLELEWERYLLDDGSNSNWTESIQEEVTN